jgi:hypothetical protein
LIGQFLKTAKCTVAAAAAATATAAILKWDQQVAGGQNVNVQLLGGAAKTNHGNRMVTATQAGSCQTQCVQHKQKIIRRCH